MSGALVLKKLSKRKKAEKSDEEESSEMNVKQQKPVQRYRFVKGPINLGREYSDLNDS